MKTILHIDASGRKKASVTRELSRDLVRKIASDSDTVIYRDVSQGLPFIDDLMIGSYFTESEKRSEEQIHAIEISDTIVAELKAAEIVIIGVPVYNFSMPAGFKAWADLAGRVGETFNYKKNGPVGLLKNKEAHVAVSSGGTKIGSDIDFLTSWLRHYLGFIGIQNVSFVTEK